VDTSGISCGLYSSNQAELLRGDARSQIRKKQKGVQHARSVFSEGEQAGSTGKVADDDHNMQ